jgi:excisionase family DNA binding protein
MSYTELFVVSLTVAEAKLARFAVRDLIARRALAKNSASDALYALHDRLVSSVDGTKSCVPQTHSAASAVEELIDTTEAAAILHCSSRWIRKLVEREKLNGRDIGGRYLFSRQTVVEYAERKAGQHK